LASFALAGGAARTSEGAVHFTVRDEEEKAPTTAIERQGKPAGSPPGRAAREGPGGRVPQSR